MPSINSSAECANPRSYFTYNNFKEFSFRASKLCFSCFSGGLNIWGNNFFLLKSSCDTLEISYFKTLFFLVLEFFLSDLSKLFSIFRSITPVSFKNVSNFMSFSKLFQNI